ncbi:DUF3786 domain-containing protein [Fibrobacterota bacterium]
MQNTASPIVIYKATNKSNCEECGEKTCFAFASLAAKGLKAVSDCPYLPDEDKERFAIEIDQKKAGEGFLDETFLALKEEIAKIDFYDAADKLEAEVLRGRLNIKCLGKNFYIDRNGHVASEIHVHAWIQGPLLNYVVRSSSKRPSGNWVVFKQLPSGVKWNPLYVQRCEKPLLKIANENIELFRKVINLFGTETPVKGIEADMAILAYPLPKMPFLICYCEPEDRFASNLQFYYDRDAEDILCIEAIYSLATGMAIMIEKIMKKHMS